MEAERQRREQVAAERAARAAAQSKVEQVVTEDAEVELNPPVATPVEAPVATPAPASEGNTAAEEKVFSTAFRVNGTLDQLRALKRFLEDGGYSYEQL